MSVCHVEIKRYLLTYLLTCGCVEGEISWRGAVSHACPVHVLASTAVPRSV